MVRRFKRAAVIIISITPWIFILFIFSLYGKWEYLSWKYSREFETSLRQTINTKGCLIGEPEIIKVLSYESNKAQIFMKDENGSNYYVDFQKKADGTWSSFDGESCKYEILNSNGGGEADDCFWWYFWLCPNDESVPSPEADKGAE